LSGRFSGYRNDHDDGVDPIKRCHVIRFERIEYRCDVHLRGVAIAVAPWVALPLLMHFFRTRKRWHETLPVAVIVLLTHFGAMHGG